MRIIFLGTPDFAVASLKAIVEAGYQVVGVVTAPDKPAGRGMHLQQSPVKQFAIENGLPVLQPEKLKNPEFLDALRSLKADLQVVIAFRMLPEVVWSMPPLGTINLHASLLPDYRGAAPINHAIINGEHITGVSTFFLKHEIDTGDILLKREIEISDSMTAGELHDKLMATGAEVIVESLKLISEGKTTGTPQGSASTKTAPKIFKPDCEINWNKPCKEIYNLVRGLNPYPASHTFLEGKLMKVYSISYIQQTGTPTPGTIDSDGKTYLRYACADGWINLENVQMESKKRMDIVEFLRGHKFTG